ncbi:hypothetical protein NP233_g9532 [Leucocoprinus birnbaumii]|uniref:N-acetyltransferase domain-containing protein n=1 Tax=Leucocoprinus birnbaumii TaxID=56174 RepID=A0AAD5VNR4_9AGAR|nr:hypothetical protein NP233_g9532 [Leucocoprinus birnbaumii]
MGQRYPTHHFTTTPEYGRPEARLSSTQAEDTSLKTSMVKPSVQARRVSLDVLNTTYAHDLPFLVATTLAPPASSDSEVEGVAAVEKVIGYAYAFPWRASYRAYRHTVEISIYVDPAYQSVGAGSALMDALIAALRATRVRDPTNPNASTGDEGETEDPLELPDGTGRVREVLSIMSLDTEGRDGGYGLANFYSKWGFEQIGHMKRVGYKFGRWIDVLMLQVSL